MNLDEIGGYGQHHVVTALVGQGFQCRRSTKPRGANDIKARKSKQNRLVQVRTFLKPSDISAAEKEKLMARAEKLGYEAWVAEVEVDETGVQVGRIIWTRMT